MSEEAKLRVAEPGSPEQATVIDMVEFIRAATVPLLEPIDDDWPNRSALLMTALSMFAGALLGALIVADVAKDQDKKRITDSMAKNFRAGIDVGKRRAARVLADEYGGSA